MGCRRKRSNGHMAVASFIFPFVILHLEMPNEYNMSTINNNENSTKRSNTTDKKGIQYARRILAPYRSVRDLA